MEAEEVARGRRGDGGEENQKAQPQGGHRPPRAGRRLQEERRARQQEHGLRQPRPAARRAETQAQEVRGGVGGQDEQQCLGYQHGHYIHTVLLTINGKADCWSPSFAALNCQTVFFILKTTL